MQAKAKILIVLFFSIFVLGDYDLSAQHCLSDIILQENLKHDHVSKKRALVKKEISKIISEADQVQSREIFTIPIVIHVVWNKQSEMLTEERIQSQIDILNDDFRNQNGFLLSIPEEFRDMAADCEIEFCLATQTPEGNPTHGILWKETTISEIGTLKENTGRRRVFYDQFGGSDSWDPESYLNIYVCDVGDDILGYSSYPGSPQFPEEDGIVIDYLYFGNINNPGASPYDNGRTLTHEAGHYFNLLHIWGPHVNSGCDEDDEVEDTPLQSEIYYDCPKGPRSSCGSSDMFMNYMNYTPDECLLMFTEGQKERIVATMLGPRIKLLESQGCQPSNGTDDLEQIQVYASIENNEIRISSEDFFREEIQYRLYSIDGKLIFEGESKGYIDESVDSSQLAPGIYILKMVSGDNRRSEKLMVI